MSRVYLSIPKLINELTPSCDFIDVIFSNDKVTVNKFAQKVIIPLAVVMNKQVLTYPELIKRIGGNPLIQFKESKDRKILNDLYYQILRISTKLSEYNNIQYYKSVIRCFDDADNKDFIGKINKAYNDVVTKQLTNRYELGVKDAFDEDINYAEYDFV